MTRPGPNAFKRGVRSYALERLYEDQEPDLVVDTIPAVLAWMGGPEESRVCFEIKRGRLTPLEGATLILRWDASTLEARAPGTLARAERMRSRRTADREHVTELAAYGLALVGICVWMPGRRAVQFRQGLPPDILLDDTDDALRGVEAAGRTTGGFGALRVVLDGAKENPGGKRAQLAGRPDVAEAHVSLWCARPRVSMLIQVKP